MIVAIRDMKPEDWDQPGSGLENSGCGLGEGGQWRSHIGSAVWIPTFGALFLTAQRRNAAPAKLQKADTHWEGLFFFFFNSQIPG